MKKIGLLVLAGLLLLGLGATVYARGPWAGGMCGDFDMKDVDIEKVKQFQKETLSFRDELHIKRLELRAEYGKDRPDLDRIAQLRKDIIDLQTKIQKIATKYNLPAWGGCGMQGGAMHHGRGMGMRCGCSMGGEVAVPDGE